MQLHHYNLELGAPEDLQGNNVCFTTLAQSRFTAESDLLVKHPGFFLDKDIDTVDPRLGRNDKEWKQAVNTAIFLATGCVPKPGDFKDFKRLYVQLKALSDEYPFLEELVHSRNFVFGALPYLFLGFRFTRKGLSENGNNHIGNLIAVIQQLMNGNDMISFLCAHREHGPELVDELDVENLRRACRLSLGISRNLTDGGRTSMTIVQPGGTAEGATAVFPDIFLKYLNEHKLPDMILTLRKHFEAAEAATGSNFEGANVHFEGIKAHYSKAEAYADKHFGPNWRNRDGDYSEGSLPRNRQVYTIEDICVLTERDVRRFMPAYEKGLLIESSTIQANVQRARNLSPVGFDLEQEVERAIELFRVVQTPGGKAAYETCFYAALGERLAQENRVMIGFERDHHAAQTAAIGFGFDPFELRRVQPECPSLYAKRVRPESYDEVENLSFRQFWRLSER